MSDHTPRNKLNADLAACTTSAAVAAILAGSAEMGQAITVGGEEGSAIPPRDFLLITDRDGGVIVTELKPQDAHGNILTKPGRIAQGVTVETQDSLVSYVNDFKDHGSRLFASISASTITAVLDYHQGATSALEKDGDTHGGADAGKADFGQHVVTLKLPFAEEWDRWTKADGQLFDQQTFARMLHENRLEIIEPDAATIIEAVRDLRAARNVSFTPEVSLMHNTESFVLSDVTDVSRRTGELTIPSAFMLRIPVYFGGEVIEIEAQLRTDTAEGKLKLGFKLMRRENVRQQVFKRVVSAVAEGTGLPSVYGARAGRNTTAE
ncbi:hypothetical protein W2_gp036c [Caulobacter phage W2]|uniref:DUF2303 family protein n=1 Tax=Caulobacter phage TMCBR4 TaxID=3028191 RepID=A0AAF0CIY1_9CAUD|nr:hypothetical protein TMCBR4_gp037c [Caulobacter phage TMCBR4]WDS38404.1 hypothetical protein W2_gp036c [Caulobacter phage W2]